MNILFVDTSAFFIWHDQDSAYGEALKTCLEQAGLKGEETKLLTTDYVFAETISLITKRIGKHKGIEAGKNILSSRIIQITTIDESLREKAWTLYVKYKDKDFDLIDATSFITCHERNIRHVLTLDRHFSQMGFKTFP